MTQPQPTFTTATPLKRALDRNTIVQDTVEQSADELLVINAVLKHEIPEQEQTGEVAQALEKTDELESQIANSAEELAQVNRVLAQEIVARAELERELAATEAALSRAKVGAKVRDKA